MPGGLSFWDGDQETVKAGTTAPGALIQQGGQLECSPVGWMSKGGPKDSITMRLNPGWRINENNSEGKETWNVIILLTVIKNGDGSNTVEMLTFPWIAPPSIQEKSQKPRRICVVDLNLVSSNGSHLIFMTLCSPPSDLGWPWSLTNRMWRNQQLPFKSYHPETTKLTAWRSHLEENQTTELAARTEPRHISSEPN